MKKKTKDRLITIFLVLVLLLGFAIILYPTVSNWLNERMQSRAVEQYQAAVDKLSDAKYEDCFLKAEQYNNELAGLANPITDYKELYENSNIEKYENILDIAGSGTIGYVTIPAINVVLPIYHGTGEEVLSVAIGHMEGSSFPIGGENTHSVIMAHRGLPSAKLFSDLDKLVVGDIFTITVMNQTLTYEVDEINIVLPDNMEKLGIIKGEDHVTLLTCTPYGVNTHRLLVRAKRIITEEQLLIRVPADAMQVDPMLVVPFIAMPLVIIMIIIWIVGGKKRSLPANPLDAIYDNKK